MGIVGYTVISAVVCENFFMLHLLLMATLLCALVGGSGLRGLTTMARNVNKLVVPLVKDLAQSTATSQTKATLTNFDASPVGRTFRAYNGIENPLQHNSGFVIPPPLPAPPRLSPFAVIH